MKTDDMLDLVASETADEELWASELPEQAAGCCKGTASTESTLSCPLSSFVCVASLGSAC
ncbi:thiocillin family RiPP [Streptomyces sp. bgisy084]|uniref:thiocillin family RiPP n=1 Tax=unclassified Streptomyces TaxID=2593676 RepID=UPI003D71875D